MKVQVGYFKELPPGYSGERRIVTVGQLANAHYQWEERAASPVTDAEQPQRIRLLPPTPVRSSSLSAHGISSSGPVILRCASGRRVLRRSASRIALGIRARRRPGFL
jgi:hypothetical protein